MNDGIGSRVLTLLILGAIGYIIYLKAKGKKFSMEELFNFKEMFGGKK